MEEVTTKDNFVHFDANEFDSTDLLIIGIGAMRTRIAIHGESFYYAYPRPVTY